MTEHTPLPCPCGAPAGLACDKNDCMSPTRYAHMAAASDPGTDFSHPTLLARIRELEEALKWYAEPQNYLDAKPEVEDGQRIGQPVTSIQADCGNIARAALNAGG